MKKIFFIALSFISAGNCFAQQLTFQKTFGGTGLDYGFSIRQTIDGGYVIIGFTESFGAGNHDLYLIKTDVDGNSLWTKTFGGINVDEGYSIQQTTDGGYIIAGQTLSFGTGYLDFYLIKTDSNGNSLWSKTYGGTTDDQGFSVQQTADGGYVITGITTSFGPGTTSVYLIKIDGNGNSLWTKTFSGTAYDGGLSIQQTTDGGYVIIGFTSGFGAGNDDVYLIKTDPNGISLWTKTFGGVNYENGTSVQQTSDGGYIISGFTDNFGAGNKDAYLIKTDANGDTLWTKTFGGTNDDYGTAVQQTSDGGYIISGFTNSFGAGNSDAYLIKTDSNGNSLWTKSFGGSNDDAGYSVRQTNDGGYIIIGYTFSFGAGNADVYIIKTDANGNSGCNQGSPTTIITTPATQITSPSATVSSGGIVTVPATIVGSGGTVTTLCTTVGIPSAIQNPQSEISISPNPTTNNFTITFPNTINKGSIEIYNVFGKKIFNENIFTISQKEIHLKNIAAGIYFVKVRVYPDLIGNEEKEYCEKLVIE